MTAGTIFDRTRTPLTVWFTACWLFATGKDGISALSLKRTLEIGSSQTAWAMLHRLRSVLVRPGRDRLTGVVAVDETYIGGEEPGLAGGRARGKKVLAGTAVEVREPTGLGRCRMLPLADASSESLHPFVTDHVEPGATVMTDGWQGCSGLETRGYVHDRRSQRAARAPRRALAHGPSGGLAREAVAAGHSPGFRGACAHGQLPARVRVPLQPPELPQPGMVFYRVLELAVAHEPVRYQHRIATTRPRAVPPTPTQARGHPPSLERPPANRPWRTAALNWSG